MLTRTLQTLRRRSFLGTCAAVTLVLAVARPSLAQGTTADPRWQAWLGCWQASEGPLRVIGSSAASLVCVTPAAGTSAVEITTVAGGKIVERTLIEANGERRARTKDGCTGWESAKWSGNASRVYVRTEYTCPGGLKRSSNGLLAMSPTGEWLDMQSVTSGTNNGVRVVRMREASDLGSVPTEITSSLQGRTLQTSAWRTAGAAQLTVGDLVEASHNLDANVVEAWLVERDQGFPLDAKLLTALADEGVPAGVIDVMVALAYPKVFALNPATRSGEFRPAEGTATSSRNRNRSLALIGYDPMGYPIFGYSSSLYNRCMMSYYDYYSPYSMFSSGCGYSGYNLYGYNGYGRGYGYGGGYGYGWYPGSTPIIVVVKTPDTVAPGERPRVVNGQGYSQGSSGRSGTAGPSGSGSSGTTSSTPSGSASSGASAPAPARTAHPKP